ncbi:NUDIX hydrolase [Luteolibacter arcticus]|uniref:NUDIX hydrolase n=1 Tax=Luteolibacter arcticus TaxID=1581411 RepID=A0ABT3GN42_9BACT|nr:NUDIX hydrolase [Luteolibacter arcticus]MCW1924896.1 NUDIX hydrolase [Luteolibacter arcticus]
MHRQSLLDQLTAYAAKHPEEAETVSQFIDFVASESDCFERSLAAGHVTGSAWIVSADGTQVLLTHHAKLDRWLQLGGHADGDSDVLAVALKEACEESGLKDFEPVGEGIFDLDIHPIPARKSDPEHLHYDVRYLLRATGNTDYIVSDESHDLRWVPLNDVAALSNEESMLRMVRKCGLRLP